ncbi:DUF1329 domain-containing protein [Marinomonas mediterranea]|jgi:Protein of unknown function (DUF1329).|uniref:DUF1329 domain-containing protein n=1 Tax=Marinomonas mediterranea (strain ATCC 700492 / JCM 21426 / NBRC 103028 / MMB-1) TaxID=717774 RepID=F2K4R4_MARM1|nr:DUF1329 domain-containing protein [Marinomonas mediterranea]ADZ91457.1 protein of unknown function DUF1329 [Marinomonas mediterranea MMB-1]WCN09424.1 DUF1329 domain-containing protein [Marinomonas mediterranea]WCN13501.1 DUF1329 domain-containing protein [Marinomonas mediterranea]WCN17566.1 DUF1329 domain-containing protein [Marinomonas mediterranea MMB-1]
MYNNKKHRLKILFTSALLSSVASLSLAAVSPEEAARLGQDLTPFGGEIAGNSEGTIPAWTGGYNDFIPGQVLGGKRLDPYKDEKPLYSVTAQNMLKYAEHLTDGQKAMLKKYPDTYRLDVYPTHRTAIAPEWVYNFTHQNAVKAKLDGHQLSGVYGGIPFPIPKTGLEAINNHRLSWRGVSWRAEFNQYQITSSGKVVLTTDGIIKRQVPLYFEEGSSEDFNGFYEQILLKNYGPPIRAGELIGGQTNLDSSKTKSYVYLAGQRRVRKLANPCCDTPTPATAGLMSFDEINVFSGRTETFDWKLLGKKEILLPYNQNRFLQYPDKDIITGNHLNPDAVRWELHRVWVVEATVAEGKRHQAARSKYYLDEDTWQAMLGDRWDSKGQLWKTLWNFNYIMPEFPGTLPQTFGFYNLLSGEGYVADVMNDKKYQYLPTKRFPTSTFTGQGIARQGTR